MKNKNELVKRRLQTMAQLVDNRLPDGYGFVVLAFPFGDTPNREVMYVSNANREDIMEVMKEWIDHNKEEERLWHIVIMELIYGKTENF